METLMIGMFVGLGAWLLYTIFFRKSLQRKKWAAFARKHNLVLIPGDLRTQPSVNGTYRGVEVDLRIEVGGGKNSQIFTIIEAHIKNPPRLPGLKIYKEGLLSKIGKAVGSQDIETGDANFDKAVMIKCKAKERAVRAYLTAPLKRAILAMIEQFSAAQFGESGCYMKQRGFIGDSAKLERILNLMTDCCTRGNVKTDATL